MKCGEFHEFHAEIENDLKEANYCRTDSDCKVLMLGGAQIDFGCYHFINKDINQEKIYQKMDEYTVRCSQSINDCAAAPEPSCVSRKCT